MKDTNKNQRCKKLSRIRKFLQTIHSELQLHSKAIKQAEKKERIGVERRTSTSL